MGIGARERLGRLGRTVMDPIAGLLYRTQFSYSAAGEDRLVLAWLTADYGLKESEIRYCDIGANHPKKLNNTFALYERGAKGVLVEPDPSQAAILKKARPRDTVLNVGAAFDDRRSAKLQRFTSSVFNTFSTVQAEAVLNGSKNWQPQQVQKIVDEVEIELQPINEILAQHFENGPHFISIDAEGVDLPILESIDFARFRPKVICIEASNDFNAILSPKGYERISRTPDNMIYSLIR